MRTGRKILARIENFFLKPADPRPLGALRIGLALVLLTQAWMLRSSIHDLFSSDGLIRGPLADALGEAGAPRIDSLLRILAPLHLSENGLLHGVCGAYVVALAFLGVGLFTRLVAPVTWLLHWILMSTGETTTYGVDLYGHVFLFYLIWMPSGAAFSIDSLIRSLRGVPREASSGARLGLRVLQLHLCVTYLCSAVEKATGPQWWNGELLWRAFNLPVYRQFDLTWLARFPVLSQVAGISSLFLELGYFVMIWPRRTRPLWVAGIVGLHLGIALLLGLHLFGVVMALLTLCVFGLSAEPAPTAVLALRIVPTALRDPIYALVAHHRR